MAFIRKAARDIMRKAPSVIIEFSNEPEGKIRIPKWSLPRLYTVAEYSWILQQVFRAKVQEALRPGWGIRPNFVSKCDTCDSEYQGKYETCPKCGGTEMRGIDPAQIKIANRLLKTPNRSRQTFRDILGSIMYHDCVADDYYMSVSYAPIEVKTENGTARAGSIPMEVYVEHPVSTLLVSDERGRLGKDEWFCPTCFPDDSNKVETKKFTCSCGEEAVRTAYVTKIDNKIKSRFGVNQMTHGSTHRVLPYLYGNPRMVSLWELIHTLNAYNDWFYDTYSTGKMGKIIDFKGYDPDDVKAMAIKMRETEAALDSIDASTGQARPKRSVRNVLIGSEDGIEVHDAMPDPTKMQALDFYLLGIHGICGVYGVQPIMISMKEDRAGGQTPYLKLEVNNNGTKALHQGVEDTVNLQLFPIFGVTDLSFRFGPVEKKDELRDANISLRRSQSVKNWVDSGFMVEIDEEQRVRVSGVGHRLEGQGRQGSGEEARLHEKESNASGALIAETTVERPKGPRDSPDKAGMVV